jgi:hypothetical protein
MWTFQSMFSFDQYASERRAKLFTLNLATPANIRRAIAAIRSDLKNPTAGDALDSLLCFLVNITDSDVDALPGLDESRRDEVRQIAKKVAQTFMSARLLAPLLNVFDAISASEDLISRCLVSKHATGSLGLLVQNLLTLGTQAMIGFLADALTSSACICRAPRCESLPTAPTTSAGVGQSAHCQSRRSARCC